MNDFAYPNPNIEDDRTQRPVAGGHMFLFSIIGQGVLKNCMMNTA